MKHKIFTIYDEKAQAYFPPFFMPKKGMAMREFMNLVIDKNSSISQHPQDYTLFFIGTFDDSNAELLYKSQKECLGNGVEFKNNKDYMENVISDTNEAEELFPEKTPMEQFIEPPKSRSTSSSYIDKPIPYDTETPQI